jgi:hypothetical protein
MMYTVGARTHVLARTHTHTRTHTQTNKHMHTESRGDGMIFYWVFIFLQSVVALAQKVREEFE